MSAPATSPTIWEIALQKHNAARAEIDVHFQVCGCIERPCVLATELLITAMQAPRFPTGIDVIRAGVCPIGGMAPLACFFCSYGHMTECHYPDDCETARCGHYEAEERRNGE